jgi:diaminohydroxyphosphoribosylaminopyrimidine deaminase/5-amino-6-(5-phosphoribosylamino)uracil reductase
MKAVSETQNRQYLAKAARAALKGRGFVEPNPIVGAVVVARDGERAWTGHHADYGGPHAERAVLARAKEGARGGTLYVTLEPCSSTGKTPPCTEAVVAAGIERVVAGALDPDPRHDGRGLRLLEEAGVEAVLLPDEACERLLDRFRAALDRQRPQVVLKWAMTLDGRIAARDGSSQWISGEKSRRVVHRMRGHADAVMVGAGTVLADDPGLNCRIKGAPLVPARIVVDPDLETPPGARLLELPRGGAHPAGPVWLLTSATPDSNRARALEEAGAEVLSLHCDGQERAAFLAEALDVLHARGIRRLLVEGGSTLFTAFVEARLADQVTAFVGPRIVGGGASLSPVEGAGAPSMSEALALGDVSVTRTGEDAMVTGFLR